jgi:hypothetical protein
VATGVSDLRTVLAAKETARKTERMSCFAKKRSFLQPTGNGHKRRARFVNPGSFEDIHKTMRAFCEKPGFSQKGQLILCMNSYVTCPRTILQMGPGIERCSTTVPATMIRTTVQVAVCGQAAVLVFGTHVTVIDSRIQ